MLVIVSRTEGEGSGAEIVLNHLLELWPEKNNITIITAINSSVATTCINNNIRVIEIKFEASRLYPNIRAIEKILPLIKTAEIIHAWNSKSFEISWYMAKRIGVTLTATMHDHPNAAFYTKKKKWLLKQIANSASKVACVSFALKNECELYGYKTFLKVVKNGLPLKQELTPKAADPKLINIGFLGMGSTIKGFEIIAKWMDRLKGESSISWKLYGEVHEEYIPIINELKNSAISNFQLLGRKSQEEIYQSIDLLAHASSQFDPYPTVLLEAAKHSIPCVASNAGGASEIVQHGKTGFLFNPENEIAGFEYLIKICKEPTTKHKLASQSRKHYEENLSINNMINNYQEFWNSK